MTLWAVGDLHASRPDPDSGLPTKPMDVFGPHWTGHMERLEAAWRRTVRPCDTVLVAGDTDWALRLEDAMFTLQRLGSWTGNKIIIRGNHDYWWSSKTTSKVRKVLPPSIRLLHNDSISVEDVNICGAKASPVQGGIDWTSENEKLLKREVQRLRLSLDARQPALDTVVVLHYPPFYPGLGSSPYKEMLQEYGVKRCVYGHLHGQAAAAGPKGTHDGIEYRLVAGDYVNFEPVRVWEDALAMTDPGRTPYAVE